MVVMRPPKPWMRQLVPLSPERGHADEQPHANPYTWINVPIFLGVSGEPGSALAVAGVGGGDFVRREVV